jgi:hypothetical protein
MELLDIGFLIWGALMNVTGWTLWKSGWQNAVAQSNRVDVEPTTRCHGLRARRDILVVFENASVNRSPCPHSPWPVIAGTSHPV